MMQLPLGLTCGSQLLEMFDAGVLLLQQRKGVGVKGADGRAAAGALHEEKLMPNAADISLAKFE